MFMISPQQKTALFKIWDSIGVSPKGSNYVGHKFKTMEEYLNTMAEYFGVDGIQGLKQLMISDVNEYFNNPENLDCPGGTLRMYDIEIEKEMTSTTNMDGFYNQKFYNKPFAYFAYEKDPNHKCEELEDYKYEKYPEELCYDDDCVRGDILKASKILNKKYGIFINYDSRPESDVIGNIKIDKWNK